MNEHTLVLLGDSILDNAPYTTPDPDTTTHLQRLLAQEWAVERLALDGATMSGVPAQLRQLKSGKRKPDVAVLSVGGNDVTSHIGMLDRAVTNASEVMEELLALADDFGKRYEAVARAVAERASRTVLCTIYEVPLEPPRLGRLAKAPLSILNDRIIRTAVQLGVDVLDLRRVCSEPQDFVLQIEPSARGAEKIAEAIRGIVQGDGSECAARVFGA